MPKDEDGNHRLDVQRVTDRADRVYQKGMDELFLLHHVHQSNLPRTHTNPRDAARYGEYDSTGRGLAMSSQPHQKRGKRVYFQTDEDYSNGMPITSNGATARVGRYSETSGFYSTESSNSEEKESNLACIVILFFVMASIIGAIYLTFV